MPMNYPEAYPNPRQLNRELKAGKEAAFDFLFRTHYKDLVRFADAFLADFSVAEDIVSDIFSNIWQKKEAIDESRSIDNYLYVSVRNACFTYLKGRRQTVGLEYLANEAVTGGEERTVEQSEWQVLWNAVEMLPLQCKTILKLVVLEDMTYQEVAGRMGISVNTVKTQMKIAYRELRSQLNRGQLYMLLFFHSFIRHL